MRWPKVKQLEAILETVDRRRDVRMVDTLEYDIPQQLVAMLDGCADTYMEALDLGCGAGQVLAALERRVGRATGVDTSGTLLERAAQCGYDALTQDDVLEFCEKCQTRFDLVLATNVLNYFGELNRLFSEIHRLLVPGGHFAFSVERGDRSWALQESGRFSHGLSYLTQLAQERFDVLDCRMARIGNDGGRAVIGLLQVWRRL
ncbi:class I SAM-dependent DNA methyltransferase [Caulobacter henricii]|uniref:Methyltransferase type 11 domain-containing protein n=1 Tax=Caulobacter henricii TaxID=69395 RepID=A0A0P0NZ06_9CAUL|nr:methyltransferase domain-containing protein [Caulobacter henricii]ALL13135.1 hypothetical protein AQ619_07095 [Caulobacter henricii]